MLMNAYVKTFLLLSLPYLLAHPLSLFAETIYKAPIIRIVPDINSFPSQQEKKSTRNITAEELNSIYEDFDRLKSSSSVESDVPVDIDPEVKAILEKRKAKKARAAQESQGASALPPILDATPTTPPSDADAVDSVVSQPVTSTVKPTKTSTVKSTETSTVKSTETSTVKSKQE